MADRVVENPILNSPFAVPKRQLRFDEADITNEVADGVTTTRAGKCHISHVVADTGSWEQKEAQTLENMPEVLRYVKNQGLNLTIPYTINGEQRNYLPDFLAVMNDGHGPHDPLNVIVEVTGEKKMEKEAKVATARTLWVPAVNNHGGLGRWAFVEVDDPWDASATLHRVAFARGT